jgi:hypothetical protein
MHFETCGLAETTISDNIQLGEGLPEQFLYCVFTEAKWLCIYSLAIVPAL